MSSVEIGQEVMLTGRDTRTHTVCRIKEAPGTRIVVVKCGQQRFEGCVSEPQPGAELCPRCHDGLP